VGARSCVDFTIALNVKVMWWCPFKVAPFTEVFLNAVINRLYLNLDKTEKWEN
jgi:hypothetical protein